jgi:hypothetical protein
MSDGPNLPPLQAPSTNASDSKAAGTLGIATIVLGNVATIAGSFEKVNEAVQKIQEQLHLGTTPYLLYVVLGIIFAGYLLASTSLYKHLKQKIGNRVPGQRLVAGIVVFVFLGGLYAVNLWALPHAFDETRLKSRKALWLDKVRQTQNSSGGFSIMVLSGPNNPPQVFTTAQGLTAMISATNWDDLKAGDAQVIRSAFDYIDSERDPVEKWWSYFGDSRPLTEIAGWVTVARIKALQHSDQIWPSNEDREKQLSYLQYDLNHFMSHYIPAESAWSPFAPPDSTAASLSGCSSLPQALKDLQTSQYKTRTYSTIMALWALVEAHENEAIRAKIGEQYDDAIRTAIGWLMTTYRTDRGTWVPNPHRANQRDDYPGLTAQALFVLYRAKLDSHFKSAVEQPRWLEARQAFLKKKVKEHLLGDNAHLSDMDGYVFPFPQPLEPMTFLWAPWSLAAYSRLSEDADLSGSDKKLAQADRNTVIGDYQDQAFEIIESGGTYELAENLFCVSEAFR